MEHEKIVREIAKTRAKIRKKYLALKSNRLDEDVIVEQQLKPIIQPLQTLAEHAVKRRVVDDETITSTDAPSTKKVKQALGPQYIHDARMRNKSVDKVYGVYFDSDGEAMLGNKQFNVGDNDKIYIDGVTYDGTNGLYELIFKRVPDPSVYTQTDLQDYKNILTSTSAHKKGYDAMNDIRRCNGKKFSKIIKPMFTDIKVGDGVPMLLNGDDTRGKKDLKVIEKNQSADTETFGDEAQMLLNDNDTDYIYWNDGNELVDRLRLLIASYRAGNKAHINEILAIIEELYESKIIYKPVNWKLY